SHLAASQPRNPVHSTPSSKIKAMYSHSFMSGAIVSFNPKMNTALNPYVTHATNEIPTVSFSDSGSFITMRLLVGIGPCLFPAHRMIDPDRLLDRQYESNPLIGFIQIRIFQNRLKHALRLLPCDQR